MSRKMALFTTVFYMVLSCLNFTFATPLVKSSTIAIPTDMSKSSTHIEYPVLHKEEIPATVAAPTTHEFEVEDNTLSTTTALAIRSFPGDDQHGVWHLICIKDRTGPECNAAFGTACRT